MMSNFVAARGEGPRNMPSSFLHISLTKPVRKTSPLFETYYIAWTSSDVRPVILHNTPEQLDTQ